jgi:arginase family enzyme
MPGSENDAKAFRDAGLLTSLKNAVDEGDVAIPSYLPHHSIPPIRSWPGPRIAWECVAQQIAPVLREPDHIPLLIGCDCSVVVGTTQALQNASNKPVHILYIDGDFDDAPPSADRSQSAAALAVWLVTNQSAFWKGPYLTPSQVTVVGWTQPSQSNSEIPSMSLADIQRDGAKATAGRALDSIPSDASILVHFDIDVIRHQELPAAYFPHEDGLTLEQTSDLLSAILKDQRVRLVEVSEYALLRDTDLRCVNSLVSLLSAALHR